jgi:hypothetical protein
MSLAPNPSRAETIVHGGEVRERVLPSPGEVWLRDSQNIPVIITAITWGRITWMQPQPDAPGYRESWQGSDYFFADEWTRLWPPDGRLPEAS